MTHATDTAGKLISWENKPVVVVVGSGFYISILTQFYYLNVFLQRGRFGGYGDIHVDVGPHG